MLLVLSACQSPTDSGAPVPADTGVQFVAEPIAPTLDAAGVDGAVASGLAGGMLFPLDLYRWFDHLLSGLETGAEGCPSRDPSENNPDQWTSFWAGDCTGDAYSVAGNWQIDVSRTQTGSDVNLVAIELYSFLGDTVPDGATVFGGGDGKFFWQSDGTSATYTLDYGGSYTDASQGGAIATGVSAGLSLVGTYDDAGIDAVLDGGMGGAGGSLQFGALTFTAGCDAPSGVVSVRDPGGGWWDITLPDDCSGCGALTWYGEDYGESCAPQAIQGQLLASLAQAVGSPP